MNKRYLYMSIALHITVFLVLVLDLPFFERVKIETGQAPIIVDLKDVKLAEMTNLPPKAVFGEEDKKATAPEQKRPQNWTHEEAKAPELPPLPEETKAEEPEKDFLDVTPPEPEKPAPKPDTKPKPKPVRKPAPKPAPKPQSKPKPKPAPKPADKTPPAPKQASKPNVKQPAKNNTLANPLKSLMDSVNSMEKEIGDTAAPAVIKKGTSVANMGIEGGTGGSYFSELTITETDAIGGYLRECWNLDPGAQGIEGMIIEVRAVLNRDGTVRDAQIVNSSRMSTDPHFRAIAESARRAIWSCQNKNGVNIYKVFADKYPDKYDKWKSILVRFNPMDATVQ